MAHNVAILTIVLEHNAISTAVSKPRSCSNKAKSGKRSFSMLKLFRTNLCVTSVYGTDLDRKDVAQRSNNRMHLSCTYVCILCICVVDSKTLKVRNAFSKICERMQIKRRITAFMLLVKRPAVVAKVIAHQAAAFLLGTTVAQSPRRGSEMLLRAV